MRRGLADRDEVYAWMRRALTAYFTSPERERDSEGRVKLYGGSGVYYTFDEARLGDWSGFTFDELRADFHERKPPTLEAFLDEPLRGQVMCPDDLWR
eukprot:2429455-Alexandrium_andersonii.AAC.1